MLLIHFSTQLIALESPEKETLPVCTVPSLAVLCTEILAQYAPDTLLAFYKLRDQTHHHRLCISFEEQVMLQRHTATTIERFSPDSIRDIALSPDAERIITYGMNDTIYTRCLSNLHAYTNLGCSQGAIISPTCDAVVVGNFTSARKHTFAPPHSTTQSIDCTAPLEQLLAYKTLSGGCFVHTKTRNLLKIDTAGFHRLAKIEEQSGNVPCCTWQLIHSTPEQGYMYATSGGGSICMYLTRIPTAEGEYKRTDNARILHLDEYLEDENKDGIYLPHNPDNGPLCCFALSQDGQYVGMGYRGKSHIYTVSDLFQAKNTPHLCTHHDSSTAIQALAWHPDKKHIVTVDEKGTISFHTNEQNNALFQVRPRAQCPFAMAFNDCGTHLAIGYGDGSVHLMPIHTIEHLIPSSAVRSLFAVVYNYAKKHVSLDDVEETFKCLPENLQRLLTTWHEHDIRPALSAAKAVAETFALAFGDINIEQLITDNNHY